MAFYLTKDEGHEIIIFADIFTFSTPKGGVLELARANSNTPNFFDPDQVGGKLGVSRLKFCPRDVFIQVGFNSKKILPT